MLYEILRHIRNFFPDLQNQKEAEFKIQDNKISPSFFVNQGQYFLIEGSALNDGVYQLGDDLTDETFFGTVTPLKIPKEFLKLVEEIESFVANDKPTAFTSESFGGYSYSRGTTSTGKTASWQNAFGTRLNAWRKI